MTSSIFRLGGVRRQGCAPADRGGDGLSVHGGIPHRHTQARAVAPRHSPCERPHRGPGRDGTRYRSARSRSTCRTRTRRALPSRHRGRPAAAEGPACSLASSPGAARTAGPAAPGCAQRPGGPHRRSGRLRKVRAALTVGGARQPAVRVGHAGRGGQRSDDSALRHRARDRRHRTGRLGGIRGAVLQEARRRRGRPSAPGPGLESPRGAVRARPRRRPRSRGGCLAALGHRTWGAAAPGLPARAREPLRVRS